jgi:hypothetical protein
VHAAGELGLTNIPKNGSYTDDSSQMLLTNQLTGLTGTTQTYDGVLFDLYHAQNGSLGEMPSTADFMSGAKPSPFFATGATPDIMQNFLFATTAGANIQTMPYSLSGKGVLDLQTLYANTNGSIELFKNDYA